MGTAARDNSQLRKSVSTLMQPSILYFFISLKTKVSHPPPWVLPGGGSKQYFTVIGHIYTSNWCICQPWYVGWSIKPCQSGVMLVLSLFLQFSFARWTKLKTNWEHTALPSFFPIGRDHLSLFLIINVKEKRIDWQHRGWFMIFSDSIFTNWLICLGLSWLAEVFVTSACLFLQHQAARLVRAKLCNAGTEHFHQKD